MRMWAGRSPAPVRSGRTASTGSSMVSARTASMLLPTDAAEAPEDAQKHRPLLGAQFAEPTLLTTLNVGLERILDRAARRRDLEQTYPAVVGIRAAFDVPALL